MDCQAYRLLVEKAEEDEEDLYEKHHYNSHDCCCSSKARGVNFVLGLLLVLSVSINIYLLSQSVTSSQQNLEETKFRYANLPRNKPIKIVEDHRTLDDEFWTDEKYNSFAGMVALDDEFVKSNGLLPAQRYPWDPSKSLYLLHAFHSLHCLFVLRQVVIEARDGIRLSNTIGHITHCLHTLREDIECYADDFPRYTGRLNDEKNSVVVFPGGGSIRMCRDWEGLRSFALENTACWNQTPSLNGQPVIENFKDCPDGSKPWEGLL